MGTPSAACSSYIKRTFFSLFLLSFSHAFRVTKRHPFLLSFHPRFCTRFGTIFVRHFHDLRSRKDHRQIHPLFAIIHRGGITEVAPLFNFLTKLKKRPFLTYAVLRSQWHSNLGTKSPHYFNENGAPVECREAGEITADSPTVSQSSNERDAPCHYAFLIVGNKRIRDAV